MSQAGSEPGCLHCLCWEDLTCFVSAAWQEQDQEDQEQPGTAKVELDKLKEQPKAPNLLLKVVEQGKESGVAERRSFPRSWCLFPSQVSAPKIS